MLESPFRLNPPNGDEPKAEMPIHKWPLIKASSVTPKAVSWLWYPYVPSGKLTLLTGDPEMGKSWIICAIAAAVTTGKPLPGASGRLPPQNVLMMSGEDGLEDTIVPRLTAMGADLDRVVIPKGVFTLDQAGVRSMHEAMKRVSATVVFIDPVQLFFGAKRDMNKANDVREMMAGLHEAAEACGCAVIVVRHKRKAAAGNALHAGMGSMDFTAAVRSELHVYKTKQGVRIFEQIKCNLAPHGASMAYAIVDGVLEWGDFLEKNAAPPPPVTSVDHAKKWLEEFLRGGGKPMVEVQAAAAQAGHSPATLVRAKMQICRSEKHKEGWWWVLNSQKALEQAELQTPGPKIEVEGPDTPIISTAPPAPETDIEALERFARAKMRATTR